MIPVYPSADEKAWKARLQRKAELDENVILSVKKIITDVRMRGDTALYEYTRKFDGADLAATGLAVTSEEYEEAYKAVSKQTLASLRRAAGNITAYHEKQRRESWEITTDGCRVGQMVRPIAKAGVYVPGGKASYPSSVLMNVLPAKIAGVKTILMATPPDRAGKISPLRLVAAKEAGADMVYKIGGAQAIAALAYGTENIPKVDKITGPGNAYVAAAKREVFGQVGIDMIAGPSEILVIADESADPVYIAADMLSQAEHDETAAAILVSTSKETAERVIREIVRQCGLLPKKDVAARSMQDFGTAIICSDIAECAYVANAIAPEHLEILTEKPEGLLPLIENAGAIFLGPYSPEPLGDYMAGPNHVLPTGGTARFSSPLGVDDFIKKTSLIQYTRDGLQQVYEDIITLAREEELEAHARSAGIRF